MDAPKARIGELDAFRGIAILAVILIHLLFDLRYFLGLSLGYDQHCVSVRQAVRWRGVRGAVGYLRYAGRRSFRRGLIVFGCAWLSTLVTLAMVWLGLDSGSEVVRFGVLHLLGIAMLLWPLLRRLPTWAMVAIGLPVVGLGLLVPDLSCIARMALSPGLTSAGFSSSDYFPLFPHLGWFLLGAALGRTAYREKRSLLPRVNAQCKPIRVFLLVRGGLSLFLYLLHQPLLYGLVMILAALR